MSHNNNYATSLLTACAFKNLPALIVHALSASWLCNTLCVFRTGPCVGAKSGKIHLCLECGCSFLWILKSILFPLKPIFLLCQTVFITNSASFPQQIPLVFCKTLGMNPLFWHKMFRHENCPEMVYFRSQILNVPGLVNTETFLVHHYCPKNMIFTVL